MSAQSVLVHNTRRRSSSRFSSGHSLSFTRAYLGVLLLFIISINSVQASSSNHHHHQLDHRRGSVKHVAVQRQLRQRQADFEAEPTPARPQRDDAPTSSRPMTTTTSPSATTTTTMTPATTTIKSTSVAPAPTTTGDDATTTTKRKKAKASTTTSEDSPVPTATSLPPITTATDSVVVVVFTSIITNPDGSTSTSVSPALSTAQPRTNTSSNRSNSKTVGIIGGSIAAVIVLIILGFFIYRALQKKGVIEFSLPQLSSRREEIKWPELQPEGQTVSTGLSVLNPLGTRRTNGAGINMSDEDEKMEEWDQVEELHRGDASLERAMTMWSRSDQSHGFDSAVNVAGAGIRRNPTISSQGHSGMSHHDPYRPISPVMTYHPYQGPPMPINYGSNLQRNPSNPYYHPPVVYPTLPPPVSSLFPLSNPSSQSHHSEPSPNRSNSNSSSSSHSSHRGMSPTMNRSNSPTLTRSTSPVMSKDLYAPMDGVERKLSVRNI